MKPSADEAKVWRNLVRAMLKPDDRHDKAANCRGHVCPRCQATEALKIHLHICEATP